MILGSNAMLLGSNAPLSGANEGIPKTQIWFHIFITFTVTRAYLLCKISMEHQLPQWAVRLTNSLPQDLECSGFSTAATFLVIETPVKYLVLKLSNQEQLFNLGSVKVTHIG